MSHSENKYVNHVFSGYTIFMPKFSILHRRKDTKINLPQANTQKIDDNHVFSDYTILLPNVSNFARNKRHENQPATG